MASQPQPKYRINLRPYRIFFWPVLLPIALLLALFNKISPIPFKIYALRVDRIGHMASNHEQFLSELELGLHPREFRVFIHRDRPSNKAMLGLLKRILPIRQAFLPVFDICHKLGGLGVSSMKVHNISGDDENYHSLKTSPHLSFTDEEEQEARGQCVKLGIDPDVPFIPVMGRDNAYLVMIGEPTALDTYRNVDINTFIPAMEFLADSCKVIRMGSTVSDRLKTNHPNILDYSLSGERSELLDIYLAAKCHFFLTCGTGLDSIASCSFRRPVLYVNYIPPYFVPFLKPNSLILLKKYWNTKEERYLTLSELLNSDLGRQFNAHQLNPQDIVVHDNTPEEILDAVKEMSSRLDGTCIESVEDTHRQERFRAIYRKRFEKYEFRGRIGAAFLRDNPYWLE
jgi:putative glycosyltransferase (TIGR04372 family)